MTALAVLPNWQFDSRFVQTVDPRPYYADRPILQEIRKNAGPPPFRVLNLPNTIEDNYLALHGIEEVSASAMHGNHLLTYDNFVGRHDQQPALLANPRTMDLLNVTLIVSPQQLNQAGFTTVGQSQGLYLIRNQNALPRAAVFYQYEVETDSARTLERLRSAEFPYRTRLLLDQPLNTLAPAAADDEPIPITPAKVTKWDVDEFTVECHADRDGILWLSENYYPAWQATDETGESLPVYRADYTFRAVVSAGDHTITFKFHSDAFMTSVWLTLICGVILLAGTGFTIFSHKSPPKQEPPAHSS